MPIKDPEKRKQYQREYREKNKGRIKELEKVWREENADRVREINRESGKRFYRKNADNLREEAREKSKTEKCREYRKQYYLKNRERFRESFKKRRETDPDFRKRATLSQRDRRRQKREWITEYKSSRGCLICKEMDPVCLDFHHRDPATKEGLITVLVGQNASMERIETEIAKCEILCSNCHRKLHAGRFLLEVQ